MNLNATLCLRYQELQTLSTLTEAEAEELAALAGDRTQAGKHIKKPAGAASGPAGGDTHTSMTKSAVQALNAQHEEQNNAFNACLQSGRARRSTCSRRARP